MIRTLSDEDFQAEIRENLDPIIVMFTGSWCQPCKQMKPTFEEMAVTMHGDVRFGMMDIDHAENTVSELGIRSVPSLALFADGMIREIHSGSMNKGDLRLWILDNI